MPSVEPFKNNSYERKNENTAELASKSGHRLVVGHEAGNGGSTFQGHFRSTWLLPFSSYSCFEIHICWNDPSEARMDPPIQDPNLLSYKKQQLSFGNKFRKTINCQFLRDLYVVFIVKDPGPSCSTSMQVKA